MVMFLLAAAFAQGQDAIDMLNGDKEAQQNQPQMSDLRYYNMKTGPVNLRFQSALRTTFIDNVNYTDTNRVADLIIRPTLNMRAFWPITEDNSLYFRTGIGYAFYLKTSDLDQLYINPDSNLSFQMFVGDVAINYHDRFSMVEDVTQAPTVSGRGNFAEIENIIGADANWYLNKLILTFGYDHDLAIFPTSEYETSSHNSDYLYVQAAVTNDTSAVGMQLGSGLTYYEHDVFSDNFQLSAGPFYQGQLTDYLSLGASAGFDSYFFSSGSAANNVSDVLGYYASLSLNHQVNNWFNHSLSVGHQSEEAINVDVLELDYVYYQANLTLIHNVPVALRLSYQHGDEHGGTAETFDRYGVSLNVRYQISQKLAGSIGYQYWDKNSNLPSDSYFQNELALEFTYSF